MGQWYNWQLHKHYHHVWWVVLYLKRVTRILFSLKKHVKIGSCSKLHIHLKRELSHETRPSEIILTTKQMLWDILSCQYCWVQLQTPATAQATVKDISWLLEGESFIFLFINTLFPTLKELLCTDMASQIAGFEMLSLPDSSDLCCLYASKHLEPNSPQWTSCSKLSFLSLHNTLLIMRKCDPGCWLITVLSHVHCHTGLSGHVKSCQAIKWRHNEINQ